MYSRVGSLLEGVCVLLDNKLPQEATILGRAMFTDSLYLMEIAARGADERAELILGLQHQTITEYEQLERHAVGLGMRNASDVQKMTRLFAKMRESLPYNGKT
jgi:hypothetical protein